jgi:hypothetical protein
MLSEQIKPVQALTIASGASGSTPVDGAIIDTAGYGGCLFVVQTGPITAGAVTSVKVQQDTDAAGGTMADLAGTAQAIADDKDNTVFYIDVKRPHERYLRLVLSRGTQAATAAAMAYLYDGRKRPPTFPADVVGERHASPAEGTA